MKIFSKKNIIIILTIVAILAAGFFTSMLFTANNNLAGRDDKNKRKIYTTFYPLQYITKQVAGDSFEVINIVPAGVEPHDFEPSAREIANLNSGAAFVYLGEEIDTWAEQVATDISKNGVATISVSKSINLIDAEEAKDPHFWLDPTLVSEFSSKLSDQLAAKFPDKKDLFPANQLSFSTKLNLLDIETKTSLAKCKFNKIIVSHDAYSYFAQKYNIQIIPITGLSPEDEPSSQQISEIINTIKQNNLEYIFLESSANNKITDTISLETNTKTLELNPIETITDEQIKNNEDYISIYKSNLNNLKIALKCE